LPRNSRTLFGGADAARFSGSIVNAQRASPESGFPRHSHGGASSDWEPKRRLLMWISVLALVALAAGFGRELVTELI
jgi:hypothetical protein